MSGVDSQAGVVDPGDLRVLLEVLGDRKAFSECALHAQRQRLEPLQEQERVERRQRRAEVAQQLHADLDDVRDRARARSTKLMPW